MLAYPGSLTGQARRFAAAALVVAMVGVSLWLFGRPEPQVSVPVVAAAEDWPAGREPGSFTTVELPAESAALFVTPEQMTGMVPAVAVPAGTVVSASLLTESAVPAASELSAALLAVAVDPALWPEPGPSAGDTAVLARQPGGCAVAVLPIVLAGEQAVVVEAEPQLAAVLGPLVWWIWESPAAGWPACPPEQPDVEFDERSDSGLDTDSGAEDDTEQGFSDFDPGFSDFDLDNRDESNLDDPALTDTDQQAANRQDTDPGDEDDTNDTDLGAWE
ncbi:MAG: hypothetical protein OXE79_06650 [Acidimicrobiaceae bacterium]|nr:hypothetical protein [Acidimicrobiaceae bacterium]MCY4176197.1 hypothetical protein [Acidimicrobiaceae bacterium]MCY4281134.1 hypothetical protein [Acidimicrobiaceae bacterium]MCY4294401.1 hypothetical protein [Acidimicrobiaceae bacterium]